MHRHNHFKVMQTNSSYYYYHRQIITYTLTQTRGHSLIRCRAFRYDIAAHEKG